MGAIETITEILDDGTMLLWGQDQASLEPANIYDYIESEDGSVYYNTAGAGYQEDPYLPPLSELYMYKRFNLFPITGKDIQSATLYWYLYDIPISTFQQGCRVEAIEDYGVLELDDDNPIIYQDFGEVMAYNESFPGWKSLDVTSVIISHLSDAYIGFRWKIMSSPTSNGDEQYFNMGAFEDPNYQAYLEVEYVMGQINIGGLWKDIEDVKINVGGAWKDVVEIRIKVGGSWRTIFG